MRESARSLRSWAESPRLWIDARVGCPHPWIDARVGIDPHGTRRRRRWPHRAAAPAGRVRRVPRCDSYADYKKVAATDPRYTHEAVSRVFCGGGWSQ
jgi:hypothetical protein